MLDVDAIRSRFPALRRVQDGRAVVFADAPGGSQLPDSVIGAVSGHLARGVSNEHGAFSTSRETDELIRAGREAAADLVGAEPSEIVFGPNATSLLFAISRSVSRTLGPNDEVVVTGLDHDANVRPWVIAAQEAGASVRYVEFEPEDVTLDVTLLEHALSERTKLVAFTLASNAVGTIPPAAQLVQRSHEAGALVVVDGVHLAQHASLDLHGLGADIVACSLYKVFGPHIGLLAVRRELLERWVPFKLRPAPDESPQRWETGTQNHEGIAGLVAAVDYIAELGDAFGAPDGPNRRERVLAGYRVIAEHERSLATRFLDGINEQQGISLWGIQDSARVAERTPTFAVRRRQENPAETAGELAEHGIFVWDGDFYAIELMERLGLSETGGALRIGFCHYNTEDEVDRVVEALVGET
ncbi:MAG: cysteine desulfurase-like protein [Actinomycetota bacterium]|nr:cysteine desulfurase-like protein [Actinomycetota bacterium]